MVKLQKTFYISVVTYFLNHREIKGTVNLGMEVNVQLQSCNQLANICLCWLCGLHFCTLQSQNLTIALGLANMKTRTRTWKPET